MFVKVIGHNMRARFLGDTVYVSKQLAGSTHRFQSHVSQ